MGSEHQTGSFTLEPLTDRRDFFGCRLLLRNQVVETKHHQRIGVLQDAFVYRKLESRLVNPLKYGDRMTGDLGDHSLERESVERWNNSSVPAIPWRKCFAFQSSVS